jgi:hypothetical protein
VGRRDDGELEQTSIAELLVHPLGATFIVDRVNWPTRCISRTRLRCDELIHIVAGAEPLSSESYCPKVYAAAYATVEPPVQRTGRRASPGQMLENLSGRSQFRSVIGRHNISHMGDEASTTQ